MGAEIVSPSIETLLIANRGEIACRVIRTAKSMGMRTVAVYSEADEDAPHVRMADDARLIGPSPVGESYLNIDAILDAAKNSGADAIHPGYGFLSENAKFAEACENAGLIFVGPPAKAIEQMGNKAESKRLMISAGVPCVPGYEDHDQSEEAFVSAAERIGYPVIVKAAAGGGGRGMRLVEDATGLAEALVLARSEAENAFSSGELILEKAILRPRHVEIQVFADCHGNTLHLGERDCSVQRRHQKVVEEAPSPAVDEPLRAKMGAAAVEAAKTVGYVGAGTVEFLLDDDTNFYFLEMNTRLQVEHPVTEMVTGLDLVEMQLRVAQGEALEIVQGDVQLAGHAIEVRLYAEDPAEDFLPSTGLIELWSPFEGHGIRVDDGIATGQQVSPFYDPMLAKIVAYGDTRAIARQRLAEALGRTALFGPETNRDFLINVLQEPVFAAGQATTAFIDQVFTGGYSAPVPELSDAAVAAVLRFIWARDRAHAASGRVSKTLLNWSSRAPVGAQFQLSSETDTFSVTVSSDGDTYCARANEQEIEVEHLYGEHNRTRLKVDGGTVDAAYLVSDDRIFVSDGQNTWKWVVHRAGRAETDQTGADGRILAPMHGRVIDVVASMDEKIATGDRLATLEAMKMQHQISAPISGTVKAIHVSAGDQVAADDLLLEIEPE
ncbi:MAG: acetyl-CoA carboxylase biotin carboxylase subunit [Rhizobiaceae bacterium]